MIFKQGKEGGMKVILLQDVKGHGKAGELVTLSDGFAKNYIIPKQLGIEADKKRINEYQQKKQKEARLAEEARQKALSEARELKQKSIDVPVKCGEGKIYGSVTNQDVAKGLALLGYDIDKKKISLKEQIKQLGTYEAEVKLYPEISVTITINVVKED